MGEPVKGTVTSLSSVFAPEDAQRASVHVQEVISERQKDVQQLQAFLNDNTALVNLVKKLPDQLHHDIMVPFGKAAFFPGRLIHTNELMVLLGEGYYAERTSKQTVEILKRRGKELESQIDTLNAVIKDLKFEASFFDETATEAAEGIVEIREEYVDEAVNEDKATTAGDDDFARILSRIDELEKEELEAELAEEGEEEEEEEEEADIEPEVRNSKLRESSDIPVSKDSHIKGPTPDGSNTPVRPVEHNKSKSFPHTAVSRNDVKVSSTLASNSSDPISKKSLPAPVSKEVSNFGTTSSNDRSKAFTGSIVERTHNTENSQKDQTPAPASKPVSRFKLQNSHIKVPTPSESNTSVRPVEHNNLESLPHTSVPRNDAKVSIIASNSSDPSSKTTLAAPVSKEVSSFGTSSSNDRSKAFTGSIVERTNNTENSQTPAPASRPVSRFKLQRK